MSWASECDLCGAFFKPGHGAVHMEAIYVERADGKSNSWSNLDFCLTCSKKLLDVIGPALLDLDQPADEPETPAG